MVVLRCTRKLLTRLNCGKDLAAAESTTRLGDWYGNVLQLGRRQHLLFISERSRLAVILPIRDLRRVRVVLPGAVGQMLAVVGVAAADIDEERARMSKVTFGPTRDRSLLGTMTDYTLMAKHVDTQRAERETPEELMRFLAQTPILPLGGASPVELTLAAFAGR